MSRLASYQKTLRRAVRGHKSFQVGLWSLAGLAVLGALLALLGPVAWWLGGSTVSSLGGSARADAIASVRQELLAVLAGLGAGVGVFFTARTYLLSKSGQVTDRFSQAVEHLGSQQTAQRVGGILALERIMRDSPRDRQAIVELLTAFIRQEAGHGPAWHPTDDEPGYPSQELQAALTVLGRRPKVPREDQLDLSRTSLAHAYLNHARLAGANLSKADLRHAHLYAAQLDGVRLGGSWLQGAHLNGAWLQQAHLGDTHLEQAELNGAHLRHADLKHAHLNGAQLCRADLDQADLGSAFLSPGTRLDRAIVTGAKLHRARGLTARHLQKARADSQTTLPHDLQPVPPTPDRNTTKS